MSDEVKRCMGSVRQGWPLCKRHRVYGVNLWGFIRKIGQGHLANPCDGNIMGEEEERVREWEE